MGTTIRPSGIVFQCECQEPEGTVLRSVKLIEFTPDNLNKLYNQVSKFPTFLGHEINSKDDMLRVFLNDDLSPKGLCLIIDEYIGLFFLTDIDGIFQASVHYTFFDKRHRGRTELCKMALKFCFEHFKFHRLHTSVPDYADYVKHFVESLGFVHYGKARKNRLFKGKLHSTHLYDMLKEECLNGKQSG